METQAIAQAMQRAVTLLERRPALGMHDDPPATARWESGTRVHTSHADGTVIATDMSTEVGGTGDRVSPGWLFRAGVAACAATAIAMVAAERGIELSTLEIHVASRTDARGILGMRDADDRCINAGPQVLNLTVTIAAPGVDPAQVRALAEDGCRRSPISSAVQNATPMTTRIDVITA
ncbi:MAG TPA: OsmC family protein [Casimicrobiaceae bacterium]|nr:OsmC family protein [Casimicrobiaceae bacterium]